MFNSSNGKEITLENFYNHIPKNGTIDILAVPKNKMQFTKLAA